MSRKIIIHPLWFARLPVLLALAAGHAYAQTGMDAGEITGPLHAEVSPSRQELLYRAHYWESKGRSDLAEKLRVQAGEAEAASIPAEPTGHADAAPTDSATEPAAEELPVPDRHSPAELPAADHDRAAQPTMQALDEQANYWEARGRSDLAEKIRQKLQSADARDAAASPARIAGERTRVTQTYAGTRQDAARSALEDSLLKNPDSLKARLDLAQIYRSTGEYARARMQVERVLQTQPDLPDALYASAQLYAEQRLWMETLHVLEQISPAARNQDMASLQKTAWAHVQLDRADALVRLGRNADAEVLLRQVALELSINTSQQRLAEPPALWRAEKQGKKSRKSRKHKSGK